jgi:hypothetical protein
LKALWHVLMVTLKELVMCNALVWAAGRERLLSR